MVISRSRIHRPWPNIVSVFRQLNKLKPMSCATEFIPVRPSILTYNTLINGNHSK